MALLVLLGGAPAGAVVMYTPPVDSDAGDQVSCQVLNLRDTPVLVTAALRSDVGDLMRVVGVTTPFPANTAYPVRRAKTAISSG